MKRTSAWLAQCALISLAIACGDSGGQTPPTTPTAPGVTPPPAGATAGGPAAQPPAAPGPGVGPSTPTAPSTGGPANPPPQTTPAGAAGTGASAPVPPVATAGTGAAAAAGTGAMPGMQADVDPRGKCTITSKYGDDKACLLAPAAEEGLQIHVGPKNYDDPADVAKFIFRPGQESSECWTFHTPNTAEVYYQTYELSGRAGTHHIINTMFNTPLTDGGFSACADPGIGANAAVIDNLPGASKAYMPRGIVAPENAMIGRKIPPNAASQADMHYFNFTDKDLLREFWMNIYFVDKAKVTQTANQIRAMGGFGWSALPIAPGTDMVYKYECPIQGNGRILALLGHYHAHGKHFTASVRRKGTNKVEKVFEMYDYLDPAMFEFDSVQTNPMFSSNSAGAVSGMLPVSDGDVLMWDCHIINDSDVGLTYTNMVKTGEMCNLWGSSLGITAINCLRP